MKHAHEYMILHDTVAPPCPYSGWVRRARQVRESAAKGRFRGSISLNNPHLSWVKTLGENGENLIVETVETC